MSLDLPTGKLFQKKLLYVQRVDESKPLIFDLLLQFDFDQANDIAVIILDTPVVLSKTVAPVCLPPASTDPDQYVDKPAVILGWGAGN